MPIINTDIRRGALRDLYDDVQYGFNAVAEPALMMGTGMLAEAAGGIAGLGSMAEAGLQGEDPFDAFRQMSEGVSDRYTYSPQTAGGQFGMQKLGEGVQWLADSKEGQLIEGGLNQMSDYALENFPNAAPGAMALGMGTLAVVDPTKGVGRVTRGARSIGVGVRRGKLPLPAGTGRNGKVLKEDAALHLEDLHRKRGQKVADPTTTRGMNEMTARGSEDVEFQLEQPITGKGWYDEDMVDTRVLLEENFDPRYGDPDIMRLWTGVAAPTSYGTPVPSNANVATRIMDNYLESGRIPSTNPDTGKLWTMRPSGQQGLELTQSLVDKFGLGGYGDFMTTKHPIRDLAQLRKESGVYKPKNDTVAGYKNIGGKLDDERYGAYILGEKGGPFMLNLNQIDDTTVDLWQMRSYGRNRGQIMHPKTGEIIDAPVSSAMRAQAKEYGRRVAEKHGLSEQDTQAVQWYFEQQLYDKMGVSGAKPATFSQGVEDLARKQGRLSE